MPGHSKWATTKHKKIAIDAKCDKLFARLIKNIEVAIHMGGDDPAGNPTLYDATQKAKRNSVPTGNVDRAVRRGPSAEAGGVNCETIVHEGYSPGGVALLVECLTDNRNRVAPDIYLDFTRHGGSLADLGSVSYFFSCRSIVEVPAADGVGEESIMTAVLGMDAKEVEDAGELFIVESDPEDVVAVHTALQDAGIDCDSVEVQFVAPTEVELDFESAPKVNKLTSALEDSDDVQNICTNMSLPDEVRAQLEERE